MIQAPELPARQVAIVLVNWNGWRDCLECLSSVYASEAGALADVYLVDNASSDGSVERIVQWCAQPRPPEGGYPAFDGVRHIGQAPVAWRIVDAEGAVVDAGPQASAGAPRLTLVHSGANRGFAGGNNVGIRVAGLARYRHFWLLNTDTVIRDDALTRLLERAQRAPQPGLVGSTLLYYEEPGCVQALGGGTIDRRNTVLGHVGEGSRRDAVPKDGAAVEAQMAYVVGASMLASAEFIAAVGLMQEDYFLYFEEIDWAMRAGRFTQGYAPQSIVYHKAGGSSAKVVSEFSLRLLYRNRVRFVARFLPERLAATRRALAWELVRHVLKRRWMPARLLARVLFGSERFELPTPPRVQP